MKMEDGMTVFRNMGMLPPECSLAGAALALCCLVLTIAGS
jgi:hypothetical protein